MRNIYKYIDKKYLFPIFLGRIVNSGLVLAQPLILTKALKLDQDGLSYGTILNFVLFGLSVYLVIYSLMLFSNHSHNIFRREINKSVRALLFKKVILNPKFSNDEKVSLLTQDMEYVGDNYLENINVMVSWGFVALVTAIYIVSQNFLLGLIFVIFTIMRPIPQFIMNRRLQDSGDSWSKLRTKLHGLVSDSMQGSQTLRINQAMRLNEERVNDLNGEYQKAIQRFCFTHNIIFFFNGFMVFFSQVVPLALGFYLSLQGNSISITSLISMYVAAGMLVEPIQTLMYSAANLQGALPTANRLFKIIEEEPDFEETKDQFVENLESLRLNHISKSFAERQLFSDLTATISVGQKVLIKGPSGSGKTTLFRLILGEEVCDEGDIFVQYDGNQITSHFQGNIGLISQHPFLFNDTIRYNLTFGQPFQDHELLEVLDRVGLIDEFQDILNVEIHNNGENISGGQRVRLELARFLLREKDILLADEVTSALDEKNSRLVRDLIFSLPITVLEIAHHIDEEERYDQILELRKG